jgi:EmrB/QacA subfamily drug resistance transporter
MFKTDRSVNPWFALGIILFAPLMTVLDVFIVNVGLPTIQTYYHTTNASVQLVVATYLVGYSIFLITGSRLGDHFGRKRLFSMGLILFTVTSVCCGVAGTIGQLVVFRFFQGVAASLCVPQTVTLIQLNFTRQEDKDKAFGYYGVCLGVASVQGQFLGGYLIDSHLIRESWRLIFLINLPIGLLASVLSIIFLNESRNKVIRKFDVSGVVLLTAVLICLVYPIIQGRELGWPVWSLGMLVGSFLLLWLFIRDQRNKTARGLDPLLHPELFRYRSFTIGVSCLLFFFGVHTSFLLVSAVYLQDSIHLAPLAASLYFVPMGLSFLGGSYWASRKVAAWGIRLLQMGALMMLCSLALQTLWFGVGPINGPVIVILFCIYGWGWGQVLPSLLNVSLKDIPGEYAGGASGVYSTIQQLSSALGVSMIGGVYFATAERLSYGGAYKVAAFCMIVYVLAGLLLLERLRRKERPSVVLHTAITEF